MSVKNWIKIAKMDKKEWFASWFDSPYYHVLYQNHNDSEAQAFINALLARLAPPPYAHVLDLACGKGRHSRYLAAQNLDVVGIDLSENSILFAQQFENEYLNFFQHDMRKPFRTNYFNYIFNFFTSFGYFDKDADNVATLRAVASGLTTEGVLVIDYFNSEYVRQILNPNYTQVADNITFQIKKRIENGYVFKNIQFEADHKHFEFEERVRLFELTDFEQMLTQTGFNITATFGSYQLAPFSLQTSPRLIIMAQKKY